MIRLTAKEKAAWKARGIITERYWCWAAHPTEMRGYCTLKRGHRGPHQWAQKTRRKAA